MSVVVTGMARAAQSDHLRDLSRQMVEAAAAADMDRVVRLDHAIRSAAMGMLGAGAPAGAAADDQLAALTGALAALQTAVKALRLHARDQARTRRARRLYVVNGGTGPTGGGQS